MLLCCVCIVLLLLDDVCGTVGEAARVAVAEAAKAAAARCGPRPLSPRGVAACCESVMAVSKGELDMANTMQGSSAREMVCGVCAERGKRSVTGGRGPLRCDCLLAVCCVRRGDSLAWETKQRTLFPILLLSPACVGCVWVFRRVERSRWGRGRGDPRWETLVCVPRGGSGA